MKRFHTILALIAAMQVTACQSKVERIGSYGAFSGPGTGAGTGSGSGAGTGTGTGSGSGTGAGTGTGSSNGPTETVSEPPPTLSVIGVVTTRGIMRELGAETGVTDYATKTAITQSLAKVETSLTAAGDGLALTSDMTMGILELAAQFCAEGMTRESAFPINDTRRLLYRGVDLAAATPAAGVRAVTVAFINQVAQRFWQRLPTAQETQRLQTLVTNLPVANSNQGNRDLAVSTCAVIGGSLANFARF